MKLVRALYGILIGTLLLSLGDLSWADDRFFLGPDPQDPSSQTFLDPPPNFQDPQSLTRLAGRSNENEKIRYLLDRLGQSSDRFIRNGLAYDGKKARSWLLYKMSRWMTKDDTADDFIEKLTFSRTTHKPYLVELASGKVYHLKSVLRNELSAFKSHQAHPPSVLLQPVSGQKPEVSIASPAPTPAPPRT